MLLHEWFKRSLKEGLSSEKSFSNSGPIVVLDQPTHHSYSVLVFGNLKRKKKKSVRSESILRKHWVLYFSGPASWSSCLLSAMVTYTSKACHWPKVQLGRIHCDLRLTFPPLQKAAEECVCVCVYTYTYIYITIDVTCCCQLEHFSAGELSTWKWWLPKARLFAVLLWE